MYNPPNQGAGAGHQTFPFQQQLSPQASINRQQKRMSPGSHSRPTPSTASNPFIPPMPNTNPSQSQSNFYIPPQENSMQSAGNQFQSSLNNSSNNTLGFQPGAPLEQTQPIYQTNPFQPTSPNTFNQNNSRNNQQQQQWNKSNSIGMDQYFNEFQSSATGQIGMQLGSQAISSAKQHISSNVGRYFDIIQWRYYFNVSNSYVLNKIQLLVFPFLHKGWTRIVEQTDDNGHVSSFAPPRSDLNAPDLYIPVMSFITYVVITGIVSGLDSAAATIETGKDGKVGKGFTPDVLGLTASTAFFLTLFDVLFVKMGNYFLNVTADAPVLELFAYSGYKFIPIAIILLIKHFAGTWAKIIAFSYFFFAYGFFTLRSLRSLIIPENHGGTMNDVPGLARKQRIAYLFIIVFLQCIISWILI